MSKKVSASDAKNNFGGLLEEVAALGRVDIIKHGRLAAVVLSAREFQALAALAHKPVPADWTRNHMISPEKAQAAHMVRRPRGFDED